MLKRRKIRLILATGILFILVLLLLLVPFRGWTRATLAPAIINLIYGKTTARVYDSNFSILHSDLDSKGFQLTDKTMLPENDRDGLNTYAPLRGCRVDGYEGIHETLTCQKVGEYKPKSPEAFKILWQKQAAGIEDLLEHNGWQKQYADQPNYTEIFDTPKDGGKWLTYVKNLGKISCELTVAYNPPYPNPDDQIWIHEQCRREVRFFGGY